MCNKWKARENGEIGNPVIGQRSSHKVIIMLYLANTNNIIFSTLYNLMINCHTSVRTISSCTTFLLSVVF